MSESIFTKIINGEIPSFKIYEDEFTYAFLDIHPVQPGHVLVVPKQEVKYVWDLEDDQYAKLMVSVKKVAKRIKEVINPAYVGIKVEGTDVPHAHVHVIPFSTAAEFSRKVDKSLPQDNKKLEETASRLQFS
jgi:histidine triad (HIT) family protein